MRPEPRGAARPVERLEHLGEREPERVRRPVRRRDDRDGAGARREARARSGRTARTRGRSALTTRQTPSTPASAACTAAPWPPPGSATTSTPSPAATSAAAASSVTSRTRSPCADGRLEHVAEHRERDLDADVRGQPALAAGAEGDDDRGHRWRAYARRASGDRLKPVAHRGRRSQAAWLEAPGPDVAHSCTSNQCVPARACDDLRRRCGRR